jgi:hypothetical protein
MQQKASLILAAGSAISVDQFQDKNDKFTKLATVATKAPRGLGQQLLYDRSILLAL